MLQEIEILVSQSNFSRNELMEDVPVYERRLYLNTLADRRMREEEEMKKAKSR
jgi:hypothetical protein